MTDQKHAKAILDAVAELNKAIGAAYRDGLSIEVDVVCESFIARSESRKIVTATVSRVTRIKAD